MLRNITVSRWLNVNRLLRGPGEDEVPAGLCAPRPDRVQARCPVEDTIELGAAELTGVLRQLVLERRTSGKERAAPEVVMPPRCADQDARHGVGQDLQRLASQHDGLIKVPVSA